MMDVQTGLKKILKKGTLSDELDFERASVIDRKLRLLIRDFPELSEDRRQLRQIMKSYEDKHWVNAEITDEKIDESDIAGDIAEQERVFIESRKAIIKSKLKELSLTQKELGAILGHNSATYILELINGVNPFTVSDLVIIHRVLSIELEHLIPTTLNLNTRARVLTTMAKLNNPKLVMS